MKRFGLCLVLALISGCATYSQGFQKVELLLKQQKFGEALAEHDKSPKKGTNELLYLLNHAMLQRFNGLYRESNQSFESAKQVIDKLESVSLVEQAGALTVNDTMMSYEGEDYEQVMLHLYSALNYISMDQWDEARVEALQLDQRLKQLAEKNDGKGIEDPFTIYLSGIIFEHLGEDSDAMIAFRTSFQTYDRLKQPIPDDLKKDLVRLSSRLGLADESREFRKRFNLKKPKSKPAGEGEVIFLVDHSLAPIKREDSMLMFGSDGIQHRISLPRYESRPSLLSRAVIHVGDKTATASVADNIDSLARRSFESHKPAIIARLLARAVVKKGISNNAEKHGGQLAGVFVDIVAMATETADTRSWLTLPKEILFTRLKVEPGSYPVTIELIDPSGQTAATRSIPEVTVGKDSTVVIELPYLSATYSSGDPRAAADSSPSTKPEPVK